MNKQKYHLIYEEKTCARGISAHVTPAASCITSGTQCAVRTCVCACVFVYVCTCSRGLMVKLPAVGFMQDTYWALCISFKRSLLRSYLRVHTHIHAEKKLNLTALHAHKHPHLSPWLTHIHTSSPRFCRYGCLSSHLSWRVSVASYFLSISYLKSSQHISNGLTVSKPVSLCLTQWNHVQNGLTVSVRWATKSF